MDLYVKATLYQFRCILVHRVSRNLADEKEKSRQQVRVLWAEKDCRIFWGVGNVKVLAEQEIMDEIAYLGAFSGRELIFKREVDQYFCELFQDL